MARPPKYQSWDNPRCEILKAMFENRKMGKDLCIICKGGRLLCGRSYCPLLQKISIANPIQDKLKKEMFGPSPPSIFVGWHGYPNVFIGPMSSLDPENPQIFDDPSQWYGLDFNDIIKLRSMLVRSKKEQNVRERTKLVEDSQELVLSKKPIDVEIKFKRAPQYHVSFSPISQPMGPTGILEKFRITENPKIPRKVDAVVSDELKAADAAFLLYEKGFDIYYLTRVLSSGALGLEKNKRLVPTRWSITAMDDIIAKRLFEDIREYPSVNEFRVYSNTYLDNHFEILVMPGAWEFELFEAWAPQTLWTLSRDKPVVQVEGEPHKGRSDYAVKEGGGYYAGRLGVAEGLVRMKRQARVAVFREIYEGYVMPVGVWEVRENVRKAMEKEPKKFNTLEEALVDVSSRLTIPIQEYMRKSSILRQRRLSEW